MEGLAEKISLDHGHTVVGKRWPPEATGKRPPPLDAVNGCFTRVHHAATVDPLVCRPPFRAFYLARALAWTGRFEHALPLAKSCVDRTPGFWPCAAVLMAALAHLGRIADAWCRRSPGRSSPPRQPT